MRRAWSDARLRFVRWRARRLIARDRFTDAARLLGREYERRCGTVGGLLGWAAAMDMQMRAWLSELASTDEGVAG